MPKKKAKPKKKPKKKAKAKKAKAKKKPAKKMKKPKKKAAPKKKKPVKKAKPKKAKAKKAPAAKKAAVSPENIQPKFKIENIVASANLGLELDLYAIAQEVRDVEYEPEQFPGAILKLRDPRASLLLFKNGKIICTGCKSEAEVAYSINRAVKLLAAHSKPLE